MIQLGRRNAPSASAPKRSGWTQFKAVLGKRLGWAWQPRLYAGILLGFSLGRALPDSGLAPFGVAFYAAVRGAGFSGPDSVPVALAVLAGVVAVAPDRLPWVALSVLICHLLAPLLRFRRSGTSALGAALLGALGAALPAAALFGRKDPVMLVFWVGFTGVVALVFTLGVADAVAGRLRNIGPGGSSVPAIIVLAAAVCGLNRLTVFGGVSLLDVCAGLVVLACAYAGGPALGAAGGAVLGITVLFTAFRGGALAVSPVLVSQSMAYVVAGMLAGTFRELRRFGIGIAFALGFITYAMVSIADSGLLAVMALSCAVAVGLFWLIPRSWLSALPAALGPVRSNTGSEGLRQDLEPVVLTERITGISRVFKEVSRTFEQVAAVEAPGEPETGDLFGQVADRVCTACSMYRHCWEKAFDRTRQVYSDLWADIEREGPLSLQAIPPALEQMCIYPDQVLSTLNTLYDSRRSQAYWEHRLEGERTVVADYMRNVARMLDRFIEEVGALPESTGHAAVPVLRAVSGVARLPKRGGHISGDSYLGEALGSDRYLLALSDGMGVGRVAATESKQCVTLLREILKAGFATEVAVKTVNSALLLHSPEESFATVDLALLDLATGRAEFVKVGAAPSFIKRGVDVTLVKTASVPVGIINQVQVEPEFRILRPGDFIVMITDGLWDISKNDVDKERWILEHLRREVADDPEEIAESLMARALALMPEEAADDLTVLVARVDAVRGAQQFAERRATGAEWVPVRRAPRLNARSRERGEV